MDEEHPIDTTRQGGGSRRPRSGDEISLVDVVSVLLRQRRIFARTVLMISGIIVVVAIVLPKRYTSTAAFLPESSEPSTAGALALAQQFGLSLGSGSGERTPQFYADLVVSSEIVRQTVLRRYLVTDTAGAHTEVDIIEYYEVDEATEEMRVERAMEELIDDLTVATNLETGIVTFSITTSVAELSYGVATHILDLVNDFDLNTRQSHAGAERSFAEERLAQQTRELREAEDSLQSFLIENRVLTSSPSLQFEHDRLRRAVAMRQELATSLTQTYEQARIDEVRNIPVITLISPPRIPALPDSREPVVIILIGIMLGVLGGVIAVFFRNLVERPGDTGPSDMQELAYLWSDTKMDVRRFVPWPFRRSADVISSEPRSAS